MGGWRVLLVDDEEDFVSTLAERMELRGINAEVAYSGSDALAKIDRMEPELVVLDLLMPGVEGKDVLKYIRRTRPNVPVIILTGLGSSDTEREVSRLGAAECLLKPVSIDLLVEKMMAALQGRKSEPHSDTR